jgi:hypothetical protein
VGQQVENVAARAKLRLEAAPGHRGLRAAESHERPDRPKSSLDPPKLGRVVDRGQPEAIGDAGRGHGDQDTQVFAAMGRNRQKVLAGQVARQGLQFALQGEQASTARIGQGLPAQLLQGVWQVQPDAHAPALVEARRPRLGEDGFSPGLGE